MRELKFQNGVVALRVTAQPMAANVVGLFWGMLGLLRQELAVGVGAKATSGAQGVVVVQEYVRSVAHVANLLVQMYHAVLWQQGQVGA